MYSNTLEFEPLKFWNRIFETLASQKMLQLGLGKHISPRYLKFSQTLFQIFGGAVWSKTLSYLNFSPMELYFIPIGKKVALNSSRSYWYSSFLHFPNFIPQSK